MHLSARLRPSLGAATGLVLGPLALAPGLRRGFLLSYDMVFVPREPFTSAMFGLSGGPPRAVPSDFVVAAASRLLPADIEQKLVLLLIFVLACSGAAALLDREPALARVAAAVFYGWNPYVAERLIIGQWAVLIGYAGLPWVLRAGLALGRDSTGRGAARLVVALLPAIVSGFASMAISALVLVPVALASRNARAVAVSVAALAAGSLPGLTAAALVSLAIACIGITEPGRALLRGAIRGWPAFAILRDAQQFIAPLALAEAIGFGLAVTWCVRPRPFGQKIDNERGSSTPPSPAPPEPPDPLGLAPGVLALVTPLLLLPGLAWGAAGRLRPAWYPASSWPRPARSTPVPPRAPCCCCPGPRTGPRRGTTAR